ncbi:MAG: DNA replication/repair protein RecF [Lachnospiraceae bacterium]|nr:DNA replication/repair protein RecF [Lachnospiraceae bacterium]
MKINRLELKNFRNYERQEVVFDEGLNILVGKNAQGKTNILEAIFFAVIGKSFKVSKEKEAIKWESEVATIKADFSRLYRDVSVELIFNKSSKKAIKIDGVSIKKIGELLGTVNAVFFSPQELKLVRESPDERRRFMNIDISQTNKRYFYALNRYEKVLANRNKLLKITKDFSVLKDTIDIWDRALVDLAEKIYLERKEFIEKLAPFAEKAHSYISGGNEKLEIVYDSFDAKGKDFKEEMLKALQKNLEKDFKHGYTSVGIHRDDLDIYLNGVEVKNFGSQGQQRTAALSMKLAELEIIKERTGEYPILLLDDVFSELDSERQKRLLNFTSRTQTIITCTEFTLPLKSKIFNVVSGNIKTI